MDNRNDKTLTADEGQKQVNQRLPPDHTCIAGTAYILLDMDGTLLDRNFDDFFWEKHLPAVYGKKNGLTMAEAREKLLVLYRKKEGTLEWTDLDYWSERLGLDIPALKREVSENISLLPHADRFLRHCRELGKTIILVTNAHPKTLAIKLARTGIDSHLDHMICADELGLAKEELKFWPRLLKKMKISPDDCFLADDNHRVLTAAAAAGIRRLVEISRPSSKVKEEPSWKFPHIENFAQLIDKPSCRNNGTT